MPPPPIDSGPLLVTICNARNTCSRSSYKGDSGLTWFWMWKFCSCPYIFTTSSDTPGSMQIAAPPCFEPVSAWWVAIAAIIIACESSWDLWHS